MKRKPKFYIAGPMTGLPLWNAPTFLEAERLLKSMCFNVENPADDVPADDSPVQPYDYYLRRSLARLLKCTHIYMLDGWEKSKGARLEHAMAIALDMPISYQHQTLKLI